MRILVCGGRDYGNREELFLILDRLHGATPFTVLIHGGAKGADALAAAWAEARRVDTNAYPALWGDLSQPDALIKHSRSGRAYDARAGFRRNQTMLDLGKPDLVVAFPGGSGTQDMVDRAKAAGVRMIHV
jgi:UDP-N-acetylmuramoylalanine-D-glutamate ligase